MTHNIHTGDVLTVLKTLPDNYFDAVLSDPPYGISFMGKEWDKGVPSAEVYAELLRVLKPGAFGLHFGGTRMWHRLAVNLEDAGFELRDTVMWLYGSGFPKSHNISKALDKAAGAEREAIGTVTRASRADSVTSGLAGGAGYRFGTDAPITVPATDAAKLWDGYGTALKPAWEPALLVQKPLDRTFANNALTHGCGGLNIDGSRVGAAGDCASQTAYKGGDAANAFGRGLNDQRSETVEGLGRFPANLILDDESGAVLDASTNSEPSRFFYSAKVTTGERNAGCEALEAKAGAGWPQGGISAGNTDRGTVVKNNHPTLKPLALTEYLARLLLVPPRADGQPRRILVPFSGAGSEMIGCLLAGWDEVHGIEIDPAFVDIAHARIAHHVPGSTRP